MKKILIIFMCLLLATACADKKNEESKPTNETETVVLEDEEVTVTVENKNDEKLTLNVETVTENYDNLNDNINKTVAFDIKLIKGNEELTESDNMKIMLKVPNEYNKANIVVYYIEEAKIVETYNVEIINKDEINYASFKTNSLGTYVLAELKNEETEKEEVKKETKEETKTDKTTTKKENTNTSSSSNKTNDKTNSTNQDNTQTESTKTINLVGAWKVTTGKTIMVYNKDYSGQLINLFDYADPSFVPFVWSLNGTSLYTKYLKNGYGSATSNIKIVDENTFELKNGVVYKRYSGEIPKEKVYYNGSFTLDVEVRNVPENLQVVGKYTATYKFRTLDEDIYNKTVKFSEGAHVNASGCTAAGKCQLSVQLPLNFPSTSSGIEYMGGVSVINIELISKE